MECSAGGVHWILYLTCALRHLLSKLVTHHSLMETNFMFRLARRTNAAVNPFVIPPPLRVIGWIIQIFTNSYELYVPLRFLLGSQFFLLSLHPSKSLLPSLPLGADVLLFLYPPTCFTHSHTCSLSLAELHFGPEREVAMKRNHSFFNQILLWLRLFTLIFSPHASWRIYVALI